MTREEKLPPLPERDAFEEWISKETLPPDLKERHPVMFNLIEYVWKGAREQALEEAAQWYAEHGWKLDEDDVPAAIRALKGQKRPTPIQIASCWNSRQTCWQCGP